MEDHFHEEENTELGASYSLTIAVEDFKQSVQLYQSKNLKAAYNLLQKALKKFQLEKQHKLVMESTYLIATILFQFEKYSKAISYFKDLNLLATELKHQRYQELSSFMQAYCYYKNKKFAKAYEIFERELIGSTSYVNRLQFFTFKARTCSKLGYRDQAIPYFEEAIMICEKTSNLPGIKPQQAQLLYDLGLEYHYHILDELRAAGFSQYNNLLKWSQEFNQSINNFSKAVEIWTSTGEIKKTIATYQIMGNIYGYLKNNQKQQDYYNKALQNAEQSNEFTQYIKIAKILIRLLNEQNAFTDLIPLLQKIISILNQHGISDVLSIAGFHLEIGKALKKLNQIDEALLEFITALNIYQRLKIPVQGHKRTLLALLDIYQTKQENEKISYYSEQLNKLNSKFEDLQPHTENNLGVLNDFWIITETGLEIFSYSPGMEINLTLFGGFVSALQTFSQEVTKKRMESFVIGDLRYSFYFEDGKKIFILGRSELSESEKTVNFILKQIYQRFNLEFEKRLEKFSGDVTPFSKFGEILATIDFNLA
ncbi:CDC27 family protein [Candidatus Lokiarchaeum ossiferum]|uniref:CDC27 family protein n=1 Tax=Candidatus Lokiarchaeum ossiferum TaxID=2951803 RepID=UPI00352D2054